MKTLLTVSPENVTFNQIKEILATSKSEYTESKPIFSFIGSPSLQRKANGITYNITLEKSRVTIKSKPTSWLGWILLFLAIMWTRAVGLQIGALIAVSALFLGDIILEALQSKKIEKGMDQVTRELIEIMSTQAITLELAKRK
jgi:hypothetical protein